jgi:hypothetical protein
VAERRMDKHQLHSEPVGRARRSSRTGHCANNKSSRHQWLEILTDSARELMGHRAMRSDSRDRWLVARAQIPADRIRSHPKQQDHRDEPPETP